MISDIINEVKKQNGELSFMRGKNYILLGMSIDIKDNTIKFYMVEKLKESIEMFGVSTLVVSLATKKCFYVRGYAEHLSEKKG